MRTLFILCLCLFLTFPALADVPQDREQIQLSFAPLVKKVAPAVVNIYTKRVVTRRVSPFASDPFFEQFFGQSFGGGLTRKQVENALGSGVIVKSDGLVITNAHVIKDAEEITVVLPDGQEFEAEKVLVDRPSDLALLRIDTGGVDLPTVDLQSSETLEVGDLVLAIGNPFGVGQTVTSGIVSAEARTALNITDFNFFIQTDAAINPGNSGGALVAMDGSVVGINSAIYSRDGGSLGIGFAVPSEMVASIIAAAESGQTGEQGVVRPWLGITAQSVTSDIAHSLGLEKPQGVLIADLHASSPAKKAGVEAGDLILTVDGKIIRAPEEMKFRMATVPLGRKAVFGVLRQGQSFDLPVLAMAPPDDPPRNAQVLTGSHPFDGAEVANINPAVNVELGLNKDKGVVITKIDGQRYGARFFRPGDLILSVNGQDTETVRDLENTLRVRAQGWTIISERNGRKQQIVVR